MTSQQITSNTSGLSANPALHLRPWCSMMLVDIQRTNATADAFEFLRRLEEVNELGYLNLQPRELFVVRT